MEKLSYPISAAVGESLTFRCPSLSNFNKTDRPIEWSKVRDGFSVGLLIIIIILVTSGSVAETLIFKSYFLPILTFEKSEKMCVYKLVYQKCYKIRFFFSISYSIFLKIQTPMVNVWQYGLGKLPVKVYKSQILVNGLFTCFIHLP